MDERVNLGSGFSFAEGFGGNDVFRAQDDGFGNLFGGTGWTSSMAAGWAVGSSSI